MNQVKLHLDWCSYQAAKFAVMNWHYSKKMPVGKLVKIGVYEDNKYIGCVIFGMGASKCMGNPFGLKIFEYCELVRVALTNHKSPVSKIVSISIKLLKKQSPKLKAIISFADPEEKHLGIIYQASNWIYTGQTGRATVFILNNKKVHSRTLGVTQFNSINRNKNIDKSKLERMLALPKYRYVYVLDNLIRHQINKLRKPYPKSLCGGSVIARSDSIGEVAAQADLTAPLLRATNA